MNVKFKYFSPKIFLTTLFFGLLFVFSLGFTYAIFTSRAYNFENTFATGTWSIPGPSGASGPSGISGPSGESGPSGISGPSGESGPSGASGPSGTTGPTGVVVNYGTSFQASGSQYIDAGIGTSFNTLTQHATWEFWIKPKSVTSDHAILTRWGNGSSKSWKFSIYNYQGSFLLFAYLIDANDQAISLDQGAWVYSNFQLNNWYHVAWVYNGTGTNKADRLKLYVNGQQKTIDVFNGSSSNIPSILNVASSEPVKIGADGLGEYFDGVADNISIWNISRSASDIQGDYLNELNGDESGLVAYWKMNEGTGTTVADSTPNSNTGTFFNSPTWVGGYPQVVLNEMMPKPNDDYDWVEIYNRSNRNIDISGWQLVDTTGMFKTFNSGTTLNSGSFETVTDHLRLTNSGDTIYLKNSTGEIINSKSYTGAEVQEDKSIGRKPDGSENWQPCTASSKDSSNNASC